MHTEDPAEMCHDFLLRAIKVTCEPCTFRQLRNAALKWWDYLVVEQAFRNLDEYLVARRVDNGIVRCHLIPV